MRLYHHPLSFNSRRAVLCALQLGVAVVLVPVDLRGGAQREPDFLRLNPNHRVPVLEDGSFVLWESHAIMQYLAETTPGQRLYPSGPRERADVNRWLFWSAYHLSPAVRDLYWERVIKGMLGRGPADPGVIARAEEQVRELSGVLERQLLGREWICGPALTLADLALAAPFGVWDAAQLPIARGSHLGEWFDRMRALEAWRRTEAS